MADLHPVVIPSMEYTFKSVTYTCTGEGLCKDGYFYDPHAEKFLPKKGSTPASVSDIEKKPAGWWKAQCAFRGLNQSGSISDLQLRLREAKKKMLPELKAAESQMNKEFKKQNKTARDGNWKSLKTVEQKATANPQKFLTEAFPKGATGRPANLDIVVVKIEDRVVLADAAERMGLETVSVDAPWVDNKKPSPDRWIVVGRTRDAVWNQMREIERETARSKQVIPKEKTKANVTRKGTPTKPSAPILQSSVQSRMPGGRTKQTARKSAPSTGSHINLFDDEESHSAPPALKKVRTLQTARKIVPSTGSHSEPYNDGEPNPKRVHTLQAARKSAPSGGLAAREGQSVLDTKTREGTWDVRGSYVISCPEIEEEWGPDDDTELTLDLYLETRNGKLQMFAMFHFIVVEGIMRFEKPIPVPRSESSGGSVKRKHKDITKDEDGDVIMAEIPPYDMSNRENYTENVFFLGPNDKPTARRPTWRYRWRGQETGEGEIQLDSDRTVQTIAFSEKGNELSGTFFCDFVGKCSFSGVKVASRSHDGTVDPEAEWVNHSEAAYEYASRARWG